MLLGSFFRLFHSIRKQWFVLRSRLLNLSGLPLTAKPEKIPEFEISKGKPGKVTKKKCLRSVTNGKVSKFYIVCNPNSSFKVFLLEKRRSSYWQTLANNLNYMLGLFKLSMEISASSEMYSYNFLSEPC